MTWMEQVLAQLAGWPGVQALVVDRVYPVILPQGAAMPAITVQGIDTTREYTNDGATGLARPRAQVDVWADRYGDAAAIATEARKALEAIGGEIEGNPDDYDQAAKRIHLQFDVLLWHDETED